MKLLFHSVIFCLYVHLHTLDNYDPEGYNPESPGLTPAGRNPYRQFIPRVQTQRSNLIGLTSSEGQGSRGNKYKSVDAHIEEWNLKFWQQSGFCKWEQSPILKRLQADCQLYCW